ncbi:MAG TPA: molybdopterin dinucleotide binding domain-containing protein, partial [Angustibacter sp.]|nr:molybdopterin dinucleotide binding domain-containing protein [Angustibacter sp.]
LRKAVRAHRQQVVSIASWATRGLEKLDGRLIPAGPGTEAEVLDALAQAMAEVEDTTQLLRAEGAVILVGERLAQTPGALSAVLRLAEATGARVAWVPRRAGERGAVEAGALPNLLPGGRPVADAAARVDLAAAWGVDALPEQAGRDTGAMLDAARSGELGGLVVGGVDPADLADPVAALEALDAAGFVVSLELRPSAVTERADVVLPVAPVAEKGGTFWDWEGRERPFGIALETNALSDYRVLDLLADELDVPLGLRDLASVRAEAAEVAVWDGERAAAPSVEAAEPPAVGPNQAVLSTWHLLLDAGRLQDGEPWLAGTARRPVVRLSPATAAEVGVAEGEPVTVSTDRGAITLPLVITDMPERAVWLPTNQTGFAVRTLLGADSGSVVTLSRGGAA